MHSEISTDPPAEEPVTDGPPTRTLKPIRIAASTSFSPDEIQCLDTVFTLLRRGADPSIVARSPHAWSIMRKVATMKATIERQRAKAESPPEGTPA